jgi:hypothetical protein
VDWVATFPWIGWQASCGLGGNLPVDWVAEIRGIRKQIGQLKVELDWLKKKVGLVR